LKRIIVKKYGTATVTDQDRGPDYGRIDAHVKNIFSLEDIQPVIITSGAIATGKYLWEQQHPDGPLPSKQNLAMLGSGVIFGAASIY
jgi:glutamate 5-kinase